jgi:hypothetical protein
MINKREGEDRPASGVDPERLKALIDRRNEAIEQMTELTEEQRRARQGIIDEMR